MARRIQAFFGNRIRNHVDHQNSLVRGKQSRHTTRSSKRARGVPRNEQLPFVPPEDLLEPLDVVQLSRMTRKKLSFPCYGMQWGSTIYLYPVEDCLVERFKAPPKPAQLIEARMYGGRWEQEGSGWWKLVWTEKALKDFYL